MENITNNKIKKTIILTLLAFICKMSFGQQTVLVTKDKYDIFEEYSVLASNKKVKHGNYIKLIKVMFIGYTIESTGNYSNGLKNGYWESYYKNDNNIKDKGFYKNDIRDSLWIYFYPQNQAKRLEEVKTEEGISLQVANANSLVSMTGHYKDGKQIGVWEYFDQKGELFQKYNYDNDSLMYFNNGDIKNTGVGYLGGELLLNQYLNEIFNFSELFKKINNKSVLETGKITLKFTIDEKGNVLDINEIENTIPNKKMLTRAIETTQSLTKKWYPKRVNGIPQATTKTINFILKVNDHYSNYFDEKQISVNCTSEFFLEIKIDL